MTKHFTLTPDLNQGFDTLRTTIYASGFVGRNFTTATSMRTLENVIGNTFDYCDDHFLRLTCDNPYKVFSGNKRAARALVSNRVVTDVFQHVVDQEIAVSKATKRALNQHSPLFPFSLKTFEEETERLDDLRQLRRFAQAATAAARGVTNMAAAYRRPDHISAACALMIDCQLQR